MTLRTRKNARSTTLHPTPLAPASRGSAARWRRSLRATVAGLVAVGLVFGGAAPARADGTRSSEWYLSTLKVAQAQRITKGAGVIVAVVDHGVSPRHPDLKGAVLAGRDTVAQTNNGHLDPDGHGTAMAGLIAARGRGGSGLLGIAPEAKILPVRPSNDTTFAAEGIRWAASHGAKVINMSFAIGGSENLEAAVKEAADADVVLVGAAGNTGDEGNAVEYPVGYPGVLGVGAVDRKGKIAASPSTAPRWTSSRPASTSPPSISPAIARVAAPATPRQSSPALRHWSGPSIRSSPRPKSSTA